MTLKIRPAALGDLPDLLAIEEAVFPGDRLDGRAFRHSLRSPTISTLVAERDRRVAGYGMTHRRRGSDIARLTSVAVAPDAAGSGVGRALLAALEEDALRHGLRRMRLEVRADNAPAQRLYEATGYRRFETVEDYYDDGTAAWRYEKALG
jgi:ribosomal-protein-alanine acetyltransferase